MTVILPELPDCPQSVYCEVGTELSRIVWTNFRLEKNKETWFIIRPIPLLHNAQHLHKQEGLSCFWAHAVVLLVEVLKLEGRGFDSWRDPWNIHWHNLSGRALALGSTHPLTEMSTRSISCGVKAADAYGWQQCHLHVNTVSKSRSVNFLDP